MGSISREQFAGIMNRIDQRHKEADALDSAIKSSDVLKSAADFFSATCLVLPNEDLVVSLLQTMLNDDGEWISYWMYECDFGRAWDENQVCDADGKSIVLTTPEDLYDFLVE